MHYHFIAIGGSAMHNLALALHDAGHKITGSDDKIFDPSRSRLEEKGILPEAEGWFPEKFNNQVDAIILGMHAREDNPELVKAQELGLKIFSYPEFLFDLSKNKTRVVIGGSHGKTTITAMILHVLAFYDKDFDYMVGAQLDGFDNMVKISDAPLIILEGDEYHASPLDPRPKFHLYRPQIALISGIAWDHINVFPSNEEYVKQFEIFAGMVEDVGTLVYNNTDEEVRRIALSESKRLFLMPYSYTEYEIKGESTIIFFNGLNYELNIFGKHNLLNMEGARKVCRRLGVNNRKFFFAMKTFEGASRRLETFHETEKGVVYRDFAHAPSKLEATIEAVKKQFDVPLVAVFELHTYSSLNPEFLPEYKHTMNEADKAVVFFNNETLTHKNLPPLSKEQVAVHFGRNKNFEVINERSELIKYLENIDYPKYNLLMMSSGTFNGLKLKKLASKLFPENKGS
jgi:UDP-N-acetylmuramate: L-alanyl-gamma-D-glutamyl-meso-diaminopimelate ligase